MEIILMMKSRPRKNQSACISLKIDFLKVRFCGSPEGRKTDFSHLQRAKFYRPDFRSAVCPGCGSNYLQSETVISFDVIFLETRSSAYPRSRNQNECARSHKFRVDKLNFENIRENQRKVVEAYLSGRDVLITFRRQDREKV